MPASIWAIVKAVVRAVLGKNAKPGDG